MVRPNTRSRRRSGSRSPSHAQSPKISISREEVNNKLGQKSAGERLADSDDSDQLVVKGAGGRRGTMLKVQEVFASGAVAASDKRNAHPTRAQRRKQLQDAMNTSRKPSKSPVAPSKPPRSPLSTAPALQPAQPAQSAQPTPLRDESLMKGIRHRKRQPSILHSPGLDLEDSTLGSFALPEDENSPLHLPQRTPATGNRSESQTSSSRKRKLNSDDVPEEVGDLSRPPTSPVQASKEPDLPQQLQRSPKKSKHQSRDNDEADIMAPPMSSSSDHSSPPKPAPQPSKRSGKPPAPTGFTTQQLQSYLMPSRTQKSQRRQNRSSQFDIPSDSSSTHDEAEEDSTFLTAPSKRKSTRQTSTTTTARRKPSKQTKSTAPQPLLPSSSSSSSTRGGTTHSQHHSTTAPTSNVERSAKSPSQLSDLSVASPPQRTRGGRGAAVKAKGKGSGRGKAQVRSGQGAGRAGGSPLKRSLHDSGYGDDEEDRVVDKENAPGRGERLSSDPPPQRKKFGKWAAIDDFEMAFEDDSGSVEMGSEGDIMAR